MSMSAKISSHGRKGLTKRWPRLRDHISSMNTRESPIWPRNITSHRMTPASRTPAACATHELLVTRNMVTRPQMIICTVGQYISSSRRGQERRNR